VRSAGGRDSERPRSGRGDRIERDSDRTERRGGFERPRFDARDRSSRDSDRTERRGGFEKRMHSVVCDKCGEHCEVPFRPNSNKPVYCSKCFRGTDRQDSKEPDQTRQELAKINEKLDRILKLMNKE